MRSILLLLSLLVICSASLASQSKSLSNEVVDALDSWEHRITQMIEKDFPGGDIPNQGAGPEEIAKLYRLAETLDWLAPADLIRLKLYNPAQAREVAAYLYKIRMIALTKLNFPILRLLRNHYAENGTQMFFDHQKLPESNILQALDAHMDAPMGPRGIDCQHWLQ